MTCYAISPSSPKPWSFRRLQARVPLLKKLAASEKIRPVLVDKVLYSIELDIERIESGEEMDAYGRGELGEAVELAKQAREYIEAIRAAGQQAAP